MEATLTSKGRITIPVEIRNRLHLQTGDVLDFDEDVPFVKATKTITPEVWDQFGSHWRDPWKKMGMSDVLDDLRGPVELTAKPS